MKRSFFAGLLACLLLPVFFASGCDSRGDGGSSQAVPPPASGTESAAAPHDPAPFSASAAAPEAAQAPVPESERAEQGPEGEDAPAAPADQPTPAGQGPASVNPKEGAEMKFQVEVGGSVFEASLEDNAAAETFAEMMQKGPVALQMRDYSGFEKVGSLGTSLPADDRQTTTQAGDIVLYTGNQIVIFYGSNSWSYTRLGKIDDLTGWEEALGSGDVTVSFSLAR